MEFFETCRDICPIRYLNLEFIDTKFDYFFSVELKSFINLRPAIEASKGSTIELVCKNGFLKSDGIDKKLANEACIINEA